MCSSLRVLAPDGFARCCCCSCAACLVLLVLLVRLVFRAQGAASLSDGQLEVMLHR